MTIYDRLAAVSDGKYRDFQTKLVPNVPEETILGVRTPDMRKIAKEVFAGPDPVRGVVVQRNLQVPLVQPFQHGLWIREHLRIPGVPRPA